MKCPKCLERETRVTDSRTSVEGDMVRRRRTCTACGYRFTTYERLEITLPMVMKKDGRREPYDRDKVMSGLRKATEKRPIPTDALVKLTDRLEQVLQEKGDREVGSTWIGEFVMDELSNLDDVAYVRFASVYREFQDIGAFMEALSSLRRGKKGPRR